MSVYVDPLFHCMRSKRWPYATACHLFADTPDELHAFAARIGLRRSWAQKENEPGGLHYDLNDTMRARAVTAGAVEVAAVVLGQRVIEAKRELRRAPRRGMR